MSISYKRVFLTYSRVFLTLAHEAAIAGLFVILARQLSGDILHGDFEESSNWKKWWLAVLFQEFFGASRSLELSRSLKLQEIRAIQADRALSPINIPSRSGLRIMALTLPIAIAYISQLPFIISAFATPTIVMQCFEGKWACDRCVFLHISSGGLYFTSFDDANQLYLLWCQPHKSLMFANFIRMLSVVLSHFMPRWVLSAISFCVLHSNFLYKTQPGIHQAVLLHPFVFNLSELYCLWAWCEFSLIFIHQLKALCVYELICKSWICIEFDV